MSALAVIGTIGALGTNPPGSGNFAGNRAMLAPCKNLALRRHAAGVL